MKDPACLFYIDTWLSSTAEMDSDVRGWYLNLLLHQYDKTDLPSDPEKLAVLAGVKFSEFERFKQVLEQVLKHKFEQTENGRLQNPKMTETLRCRETFKDKRARSGNVGVVIKLAASIGFKKSEIDRLKSELYEMEDEQMNKHKDKQVLEHLLKLYRNGDGNKDKDGDKPAPEKPRKKTTEFVPPSEIEVIGYFVENGMTEAAAKKAFQYYEVANWIDSKGNAVKNWKQKMQGVWFKEENKAKEVAYTPPPQERTYTRLTDWLKAHPNAYEDSLIGNFMRAGIDPNDHGACRRWLLENGYSIIESTQMVYLTERWMERMSKA